MRFRSLFDENFHVLQKKFEKFSHKMISEEQISF